MEGGTLPGRWTSAERARQMPKETAKGPCGRCESSIISKWGVATGKVVGNEGADHRGCPRTRWRLLVVILSTVGASEDHLPAPPC